MVAQTMLMLALLRIPVLTRSVSLDSLFYGGAVLQRDAEVAVWGTAPPGGSSWQQIQVELDGSVVAHAFVGKDSTWRVILPSQKVSWHRTLRVTDQRTNSTAEATVSFGEVLLCSGQSNMDMPVSNDPGQFQAENGTAETDGAERYAGKISLAGVTGRTHPAGGWNGTGCGQFSPATCKNNLTWNQPTASTVGGFSAVCWYTGKTLYERLDGAVPVGLMYGSVGGSPIEFWLPPGHVNNSICGFDKPACDNKKFSDSDFFKYYIAPLVPYTVGSVIWDQGERDVHCYAPATNTTWRYPCMERELIRSWRDIFNSSFVFLAVQLPGYIGDCDAPGANPESSYYNCVPGVFDMRLAQETGTADDTYASIVVTYDLSCPFGVKTPQCPWGSVHNVRKAPVGERLADELRRLRRYAPDLVTEGPRATTAFVTRGVDAPIKDVSVHFKGGTTPFQFKGTQYCAACCNTSSGSVGDFDASGDGGATWVNATGPARLIDDSSISFSVPLGRVTHVRYTANQAFPQCALYNKEGLPAFPFTMEVASSSAFLQATIV